MGVRSRADVCSPDVELLRLAAEPELKIHTLQSLWDKAYDNFKTRNPQLSIAYENILASTLCEGSAPGEHTIEQANAAIRHDQIVQVVEGNLRRIQRRVDEKGIPDHRVRSTIGPLAALSFALDIVTTNPMTKASESSFHSMVALLRRILWQCRLPEIFLQLDSPEIEEYSPRLRQRIEKAILHLYTISLEIEIECVFSHFRARLPGLPEMDYPEGDKWEDMAMAE